MHVSSQLTESSLGLWNPTVTVHYIYTTVDMYVHETVSFLNMFSISSKSCNTEHKHLPPS